MSLLSMASVSSQSNNNNGADLENIDEESAQGAVGFSRVLFIPGDGRQSIGNADS